jgi:hypothetical protein
MALVASASRTRTDAFSVIEASTFAKVQAACNFVNAEVARLRHRTIAIWVGCALGALLLWIGTGLLDPRIALVLVAGACIVAFVRAREELIASYRGIAAKRIVAGVGSHLKYNATSTLTRQHFDAMDLFPERCDRWVSRDEIAARTRGAKYSLHQVRAVGKNGKAAFFDGVVIRIDFDEGFPGHTVILPDRDGRTLGTANGTASARRKKDLVMVKNPAFEQVFAVYSTDYYEARQLVTPKFMEVVLDARARLGTELRLCFLNKSLFIAVAGHGLRFGATLFAPPLTPQAAIGKLVLLVAIAERLGELRS